MGINMNMAPVLDVNSNPENPVIGDRAFGADPGLVAELGQATIGGLQDNMVVACGNISPAMEMPRPTRTRYCRWWMRDFSGSATRSSPISARDPVRWWFDDGACALSRVGSRCPGNPLVGVIQRLLREEFRYDGVVFTDDLEMHAIIDHDGIGEAAVRSFVAGCDVLLICKDQDRVQTAMQAMERAVRDGRITQERLQQSLVRVARLKSRYLFTVQTGHHFRCPPGGGMSHAQDAARFVA